MAADDPATTDVFSLHRSRAVIVSLGAAFGVIVLLFAVGEALAPGQADRRSGHNSWSYGAQGFRAVYEVLEDLGYRVSRFQRTYRGLPPAASSVVLMLDPGSVGLMVQRAATGGSVGDDGALLREWVEGGGRLIITRRGRWVLNYLGFEISTGAGSRTAGSGNAEDPAAAGPAPLEVDQELSPVARLLPAVPPPVRTLPAAGALRTHPPLAPFAARLPVLRSGQRRALRVYLSGEKDAGVELFESVPDGAPALITLGDGALALDYALGEGRVVYFSSALPFASAALKWTPAAEVVTTLVHYLSDGGRRRLYFDESTHGFLQSSGLLRWARETALFYPVASALIGILIAGWYGAVRFGPARSGRQVPRRAKEEFVLSLGDMYRRGAHYDHVLALIAEAYAAHLAQLLGRAHESRPGEPGTAPASPRFSYSRPQSEKAFVKEARRLHEQYLSVVRMVRGKEGPTSE